MIICVGLSKGLIASYIISIILLIVANILYIIDIALKQNTSKENNIKVDTNKEKSGEENLSELERLNALKDKNVISNEEFQALKKE